MHFLHQFQPEEIQKVVLMTCPEDGAPGEECRVLIKPFNRDQLVAEVTKSE
jgi:hypothetical protein